MDNQPKINKKTGKQATKEDVTPSVKTVEKKVLKARASEKLNLTIPAVSLDGKEDGTFTLSETVFGKKVNKTLIAQAIRVYLNNKQAHFSNTKTRGEVNRTGHKIYRQKGTGGARHGSRKAPIYVGGGVALGPKYRKVELELPQKMKKAALFSSLIQKVADGEVWGLLEADKASGKTAQLAKLLKSLNKKGVLIITGEKNVSLGRAARNIPNANVLGANYVNAYEIVSHPVVLLTKDAIERLEKLAEGKGSAKE